MFESRPASSLSNVPLVARSTKEYDAGIAEAYERASMKSMKFVPTSYFGIFLAFERLDRGIYAPAHC
jgi:hypothetical protein